MISRPTPEELVAATPITGDRLTKDDEVIYWDWDGQFDFGVDVKCRVVEASSSSVTLCWDSGGQPVRSTLRCRWCPASLEQAQVDRSGS